MIRIIKFLGKLIGNKTVFFVQSPWGEPFFVIRPERLNGYVFCPVQIGKRFIHEHCGYTAATVCGRNSETADAIVSSRKQHDTDYLFFFFYTNSLSVAHEFEDGSTMLAQLLLCFQTRKTRSHL